MNKWSKRSKKNLAECHRDLVILADVVLQIHDCSLICGFRDKLEQDEAFYLGNSKIQWPNSKHNSSPSMAMDLAPYIKGQSYWDREQTLYFAGIVVSTAYILYEQGHMEHKLKWGGDWDSDNNFKEHKFYDGVHFELI